MTPDPATPLGVVGMALVGKHGRLLDFDDAFDQRLASTGDALRVGTDVTHLMLAVPDASPDALSGGGARAWWLESVALFRSGSALCRLRAAGGTRTVPEAPESLIGEGNPLAEVVAECEETEDLAGVRTAVSATLVSVLRARRSNERRIRIQKIEVEAKSTALVEVNRALQSLSSMDPLTGLLNRRGLESMATEMWESASSLGAHFGVVLLDIDGFKSYNDAFGHLRGDECLRRVSSALEEASRAADIVARYGGEEFLVIVTGTDERACAAAAERLCAAVESLGERHPNGGVVTISGGFHSVVPGAQETFTDVLDRADLALYAAKERGRNRVDAWDAGIPSRQSS